MTDKNIIHCKDVRYRYKSSDKEEALKGINLSLDQGSVLALIGPNGSGKSTLLNIMLGLHPPNSGKVSVMGYTPWLQRDKLTADVTFVSDVASLPKWATVKQLRSILAQVHPRFRLEYFDELLDTAKISNNKECGAFSKGQLAYVHLSLALAVDAHLLILDEPTLGLDVAARRHFHSRLLVDYCKGGRSLVVTTHYPDELVGLVTHTAFLTNGEIVLTSNIEDLAKRFVVVFVNNEDKENGLQLKPLYHQVVLGGTQMLYDTNTTNIDEIKSVGSNVSGATLSDIYLAYVVESEQVVY